MEEIRAPFQGVKNIIRFNWHLYVLSALLIATLILISYFLNEPLKLMLISMAFIMAATSLISILASYHSYDLSGLYDLKWLQDDSSNNNIISLNAGFDETSELLALKYQNSTLQVFDFYNPIQHTEMSIKRARKAYPPYKGTINIATNHLPVESGTIDRVFLILSAHEIRNMEERVLFFKELKKVIKDDGEIILVEHLRDIPNFLAYNIGAFHFLSRDTWISTVRMSGLKLHNIKKITPLINIFTITKYGCTS